MLRSHEWSDEYRTGELEPLEHFYKPAMERSSTYWRVGILHQRLPELAHLARAVCPARRPHAAPFQRTRPSRTVCPWKKRWKNMLRLVQNFSAPFAWRGRVDGVASPRSPRNSDCTAQQRRALPRKAGRVSKNRVKMKRCAETLPPQPGFRDWVAGTKAVSNYESIDVYNLVGRSRGREKRRPILEPVDRPSERNQNLSLPRGGGKGA